MGGSYCDNGVTLGMFMGRLCLQLGRLSASLASFLHRFQAEFKSGFGSWLMTEAGCTKKLEGISWNRYLAFCFLCEQELICHFLLEADSGFGDAGEEAKAKTTKAFRAARLKKWPYQY